MKKDTLHPQAKAVLGLLVRGDTVTRLTAMHYGIANITARIADLRIRHGLVIQCVEKTDAQGQRYGSWRIPQWDIGYAKAVLAQGHTPVVTLNAA